MKITTLVPLLAVLVLTAACSKSNESVDADGLCTDSFNAAYNVMDSARVDYKKSLRRSDSALTILQDARTFGAACHSFYEKHANVSCKAFSRTAGSNVTVSSNEYLGECQDVRAKLAKIDAELNSAAKRYEETKPAVTTCTTQYINEVTRLKIWGPTMSRAAGKYSRDELKNYMAQYRRGYVAEPIRTDLMDIKTGHEIVLESCNNYFYTSAPESCIGTYDIIKKSSTSQYCDMARSLKPLHQYPYE